MIPKPEVLVTRDFVDDTVARILDVAASALQDRGQFSLSLCGGGTPRPIYTALAQAPLDWSRVLLTFGDERTVPPDHAESNYRMVKETLLDRSQIPASNVLRMRGEIPPEEAAEEYELLLREFAGALPLFVHDLILLGVGGDGHTASLFPGTAALGEQERQVVANVVPQLNTTRLTLTYPAINAARQVFFLVNDPAKQPVIDAILAGDSGYPSEAVRPDGDLVWILGA